MKMEILWTPTTDMTEPNTENCSIVFFLCHSSSYFLEIEIEVFIEAI